ncbi:MAG: class I SAM-dependent methyltransferase [Bacteroidota bacterium]|nr:class I SAM-dependent methyltransferase [Bacteroidota bacterium]
MKTEYNYETPLKIEAADNIKTAIKYTIINYMYHQLGWNLDECMQRVEVEFNREIPKSMLDYLEHQGWEKTGKLLDLGSGQGGLVEEALLRGYDAYGVEPGEEFVKLSKLRLKNNKLDETKVLNVNGENLPFEDNTFDYVISLQVLEHVKDPIPILKEIFRVLKPNGKCYLSCENYLAFKEQHYRVKWLPLLPKFLGAIYLRLKKKNPSFLLEYVHYTTYPQIWRMIKKVGFINETYNDRIQKIFDPEKINSSLKRSIMKLLNIFPKTLVRSIYINMLHINNLFRVGVRVQLIKPKYE